MMMVLVEPTPLRYQLVVTVLVESTPLKKGVSIPLKPSPLIGVGFKTVTL
jgi:hypothetical protein